MPSSPRAILRALRWLRPEVRPPRLPDDNCRLRNKHLRHAARSIDHIFVLMRQSYVFFDDTDLIRRVILPRLFECSQQTGHLANAANM